MWRPVWYEFGGNTVINASAIAKKSYLKNVWDFTVKLHLDMSATTSIYSERPLGNGCECPRSDQVAQAIEYETRETQYGLVSIFTALAVVGLGL